jgi:hypothetical protein
VLISRGLQHDDSLDAMAAGMGRDETGQSTSLIGAVIDLLLTMQGRTSNERRHDPERVSIATMPGYQHSHS